MNSKQEKLLFFQKMFNHLDQGIEYLKAIRNDDGEINDFEFVYVNDAALQFVPEKGQMGASIAGTRLLEVFPAAGGTTTFSSFVHVVEKGDEFETEVNYSRDGENGWYSQKCTKLDDGLLIVFTEITRNKKAQREQQNFVHLAETIPSMVFTANREGSNVYVNDYYSQYTGCSVKNLDWKSIIHQEDLPEYLEHWEHAKSAGSLFERRVRVKRHDGQYRWHMVRIMPLKDESGEIQKWMGTSYDIDELTELQQKLTAHAKEMKFLANSIPHIVWHADPDGQVNFYNRKWFDVTGIDEDAGKDHWPDVIHPNDSKSTIAAWEHSVKTGKDYKIEHRIRLADGTYRWMRSHAIAARDADGRIIRWYGTATDIHEEMLLNQRLKRSYQESAQIIEMIPQLVWVTTAEGENSYFNNNWYEYTGQTKEQSRGSGWLDVLKPEDRERTRQVWNAAVSTGSDYYIEYRLRSRTGEYRWFLVKGVPVQNEEGETVKWFGTCTDIQLQKELDQEKEDFLKITGHEIRTPLTTILAYQELILDRVNDEGVGAEVRTYVEKVYKSSLKIKNLIEDLLEFNHSKSDRLPLNLTNFNLGQSIKETAENIQTHYKSHKISVIENCNQTFKGDKRRIDQLIANLLTNAIKYSPGQDHVLLSLACSKDQAILKVQDFGIGIPQDAVPNIFKKFYRAVDGPQFKGLGIGLFVAKKIVDFHHGAIEVASEPGKGSVFTVKLPLREPESV